MRNLKDWSFTTCGIVGFVCCAIALGALYLNAVNHNAFVTVAVPVAIIALVAGGIATARARWLWTSGRGNPKR